MMKRFDEDFTSGVGRRRPVALLDIDHTVVYTDREGRDRMNIDLLEALKANSMRDVYFFTDMTFSAGAVLDRLKIIHFLESQGFKVHGTITPLDYFWESDPQMLKKFEEDFISADIILRKGWEKNLDKLEELLAGFPEIQQRKAGNDYPSVGVAFNEASRPGVIYDEAEQLRFKLHSAACKTAIDIIGFLRGLASSKGIMFAQFMAHKPSWVSACYVFDDKDENLVAVKQSLDGHCKVYTVHGDFSDKVNTFVEHFLPDPEDVSLEVRLGNVVCSTFEVLTKLQSEKKLGNYFYKKEHDRALSLLSQINVANDSFEEGWGIVLDYLRGIQKRFFGSYQPSVFDKQLLYFLSIDPMLSRKLELHECRRDDDYQRLLERLLPATAQSATDRPVNRLYSSAKQGLSLSSLRTGGARKPLPPSPSEEHKQSWLSTRRPRSFSAITRMPDNELVPAMPKSASEEAVSQTKKSDFLAYQEVVQEPLDDESYTSSSSDEVSTIRMK